MPLLAGVAGGASVSIVVNAVDKFSKTFAMAGTQMKGLVGFAQKNQAALLGAGAAITAVGVASTVALGGAVKQAMSYESAMTGVRKTVELTEEEFKELENRFKSMSKTIPLSFQELAGIGEIAGQLGVQGVENISTFTRTIADISATTNLTAEEAATAFARFANIMNMPIDQVDKLGSVVVDLGNNLATTEAEIVSMGMRIAGAGAALDMTEGEIMAWAGALSSMGVRAEMGGTAISKFMINISSMVATNSPELEKFATVAGMTSAEFTKAFEQDASRALQVFFEGLGNVEKQGGDVLLTLENLGITEVRLRDTVLRLAAGEGTLTEALSIQDTAWTENIALSEEAEKRYETMESQLKMAKNAFRNLGAELGVILFPLLEKLIGLVNKITAWFSNLTEGQKKFIVIAGAVVAVLGLVIGPLLILLAMLPMIAAGFGMITLSILPWIIAIVAAIAIGWLLIKNWDKVKEAAGKLGVFLKNIFVGIHNIVATVWNGIIGIIEGSINRIVGMINSLIKILNKIPGVNIGTIGGIDFGAYKAGMMKFATYTPPITPEATAGDTTNVYNIENINGLSGRDIADSLQEELNKKI